MLITTIFNNLEDLFVLSPFLYLLFIQKLTIRNGFITNTREVPKNLFLLSLLMF